jgi:hypothetical protein
VWAARLHSRLRCGAFICRDETNSELAFQRRQSEVAHGASAAAVTRTERASQRKEAQVLSKSTLLLLQISRDRLMALDEAIVAGDAENRSAAVAAALDDWIDRRRTRVLGVQSVAEYTRVSQQPSEVSWVRAASEASIAAEPW